MNNILKSLQKNTPLLIVAGITLALFLYPYLQSNRKDEGKKDSKKKTTPVSVVKASKGSLTEQYRAIATVQGWNEVSVLSQVEGVLEKVNVQIGDTVRKGKPLALLDSRLQQASLLQAKAQLTRSLDEYNRAKTLAGRRLTTQTRLQTALEQKALYEAEVNKLSTLLSFTRFNSPIGGVVTRQNVFTGNSVQVGDHLFTISDVSRLMVVTKVPENTAAHLKPGDTALLHHETFQQPIAGKVRHVYPASDPVSHQVGVEIDAGAAYPLLKPGYQVTVMLPIAMRENALVLDRKAITQDPGSGTANVFVVKDGQAEKRTVKLGLALENQVEVTGGLSEGDLVVVRGNEGIKEGDALKYSGAVKPQRLLWTKIRFTCSKGQSTTE